MSRDGLIDRARLDIVGRDFQVEEAPIGFVGERDFIPENVERAIALLAAGSNEGVEVFRGEAA
ncbi:hypothetical protein [Aquisphaera insulae]|uniref:hypothetical protein n=1 Tax=Aquisphaera insulae TaxID=2712864 RepID=UPI0013E9C722|nr:hypothetical protein [Aquisphaera insulae]